MYLFWGKKGEIDVPSTGSLTKRPWLGQAAARGQGIHPDLLHRKHGLKHLSCSLLPSQM